MRKGGGGVTLPRFCIMKLSKSEKSRLQEATAQFNIKRAQFLRRIGEEYIEAMPEKANAAEIGARVDTKSELEAIIRDMRAFAKKRGISFQETGYIVKSDWELNIAKREVQKVNAERIKQRKARGLENTINPRNATMKDLQLVDKKIPVFKTEKGFSAWLKALRKQSKPQYYSESDKRYVDSLMKSIRANLPRYADKIISALSRLGTSEIVDLINAGTLNINYTYGAEAEDAKAMQMLGELDNLGLYNSDNDEEYQEYIDNGADDELDYEW